MDDAAHVVIVHSIPMWSVLCYGCLFGVALRLGMAAAECFAAMVSGAISGWRKARSERKGDDDFPRGGMTV